MKNMQFAIILTTLVVVACGTPALVPTNTPVPLPTETLVPPTETLEPSPTLVPSPTLDPLIFRDDFEGSLGEGWEWVREDKKSWSLTNNAGWLELMARAGNVGSGTIENMLLRTSPDVNFELETQLKFKPAGNFQIAGLLIYESAANSVLFGRAFCDGPQCAGDGYYFDQIANNSFISDNFATAAPESDTVYLRLRREGNSYTAYASEDGNEWRVIGAHVGEMNPLFVGLVAGQAVNSVPKPAQFNYFMINALP